MTKDQLLLLWNSKDHIEALTELKQRRSNGTLTPERVKDLALKITGSDEESDSVSCNYYHQNYKSEY